MEYKEILFSTEGEIAILTLNRPEKINALSKQMIGGGCRGTVLIC